MHMLVNIIKFPEDGTLVPKHVAVWHLSCIVFYDLCSIVFDLVRMMVNITNVKKCTAWIA